MQPMKTGRQWIATDFGGPEVLQLRDVAVPPPGPGEATIAVRAAGMNPADYKHFGPGQDRDLLPLTIGYEAAGVLAAVGPGTSIATGAAAVTEGDTVLLHGAAGAVGLSVLQQARLIGARVIGTASADNFGILESFGAVPVPYGGGPDVLAGRVAAPRRKAS